MKKTLAVLGFIIALSIPAVSDEITPPTMRPAAPDIPLEVKDDANYTPNTLKPYKEPAIDEIKDTNDEEYEDEEYIEDDSIEDTTNSQDEPTENIEPESNSTTNTNVSSDSVKNKDDKVKKEKTEPKKIKPIKQKETNKTQTDSSVKPQKQEKTKKEKKQKPKYGKYNDVNEDLYIQDWENSLKESGGNGSETSDTESQEQHKTYTQDDYEQIYRDLQVPTFTFVHGVDPDQYYDMKDTTWSPYPLLRLNSPLYFKTVTIEPGYYLLTPREYKGDWYILFKESGVVKYTIPAFERSFTPSTYYRDNLKELDMKPSARWQVKFLNAWGKIIRKSKRRPATQCNIELTDLDNNFLLLDLYYGAHRYSTLFRIEKF